MSTREQEHRVHHVQLHEALEMLVSDYLAHHPTRVMASVSVLELFDWSNQQTIEPVELQPHRGVRLRLVAR